MRDLAAAAEAEFAARGMPLQPGAALQMLRERVADVARQAGVTPRTAQGYLTLDGVREIARSTARTVKEHDAAEAELAAVPMTMHDVGLVVSAFGVAAQLAVVNGDTALAAGLCDLVGAVALALRSDATTSPGQVPAKLLRDGGRLIWECVDKLTLGLWSVQPGSAEPQRDAAVAAQLTEDVTAVCLLLADPDL